MRTLDTAEMNNVSGGTFGLIFGLLSSLKPTVSCAPAKNSCAPEPAPCKPAPVACPPVKKGC